MDVCEDRVEDASKASAEPQLSEGRAEDAGGSSDALERRDSTFAAAGGNDNMTVGRHVAQCAIARALHKGRRSTRAGCVAVNNRCSSFSRD